MWLIQPKSPVYGLPVDGSVAWNWASSGSVPGAEGLQPVVVLPLPPSPPVATVHPAAQATLPPPLNSMSIRKLLALDQLAAVTTSAGTSRRASAGVKSVECGAVVALPAMLHVSSARKLSSTSVSR